MDDRLRMACEALAGGNNDVASACALVAIAEALVGIERHLDVLAQVEVARVSMYDEFDPGLFDPHYSTDRPIEDTKPL